MIRSLSHVQLRSTAPPFLQEQCQGYNFIEEGTWDVRHCRRMNIAPEGMRLEISYTARPLAVGMSTANSTCSPATAC